MNKIKLFILSLFLLIPFIVKADTSSFIKAFNSDAITFNGINNDALYKIDNLKLDDTVLTVTYSHGNGLNDKKCEANNCLVIEQYDEKGKKINELYIQNAYAIVSPNVIDNNLYLFYKYCSDDTCEVSNDIIKKYDRDLKEVASYDMGFGSIEAVDVFATSVSALCETSDTGLVDGLWCEYYSDDYNYHYYDYYDFYQITSDGESIIIYNRGEDLVLDKNLTSMYRRANSWKGKYGDGSDYSYKFINANEYLIAGSLRDNEGYSSFIKAIKDNQETFYYTDSHYLTFLFPIKVNDKYVVLGLSEREETDIIVIDENGRIIQKFSGNYWNLRSVKDGFAVTNLGTSIYDYMANSGSNKKVYTEVYYDYNVRIESDGNGEVILDRKIVDDKEYIVIKTNSDKGYVLKEIQVVDKDGKEIQLKDNSFLVPASDTRVLAEFKKVNNPLTGDNIMIIVLILVISGGLLILLKRQRAQRL